MMEKNQLNDKASLNLSTSEKLDSFDDLPNNK